MAYPSVNETRTESSNLRVGLGYLFLQDFLLRGMISRGNQELREKKAAIKPSKFEKWHTHT